MTETAPAARLHAGGAAAWDASDAVLAFLRRTLQPGELWLYSPHHAGAFDSRYFGPARVGWVRAVVVPVWTR